MKEIIVNSPLSLECGPYAYRFRAEFLWEALMKKVAFFDYGFRLHYWKFVISHQISFASDSGDTARGRRSERCNTERME